MRIEAHETWWVSTAILVNCSLNFYVYCLSGKTFRNEIRRLFEQLFQNHKVPTNRRKQYYHNDKTNNLIYKQCSL
jgi:hypothetical protein